MFLGLTSENSAPDGFPDHRLRHNSSAIWGHVLPSAIIWKIRASFALKRMVFVLRHPTAPSGACGSATVIPRPRPWNLSSGLRTVAVKSPISGGCFASPPSVLADGRAFDGHYPSTCGQPFSCHFEHPFSCHFERSREIFSVIPRLRPWNLSSVTAAPESLQLRRSFSPDVRGEKEQKRSKTASSLLPIR